MKTDSEKCRNLYTNSERHKEKQPLTCIRPNFYSVKNKLPGQNILDKNIIVSTTQKEGPVTVDLREYNITLEDDTFVSMEWIEDMGDFGLSFATATTGATQPTITCKTSQGNWKGGGKYLSNVGIGITLTVLQ